MSDTLPVAVDAMGGDEAPAVIVAGAIAAVRAGIPVILVGDEARIRPLLPRRGAPEIVHTPDVVEMNEGAASAVRRKTNASVRVAMRLVADGRASAVVSCGSTGAALVAAHFDLGVVDGVERPALASILPRSDGGKLVMLDAGANVDCKPEMLANFALLGAAYAESIGVKNPRIGLLANGEEDGKGNVQVRATLPLLRTLPLDVIGNVEPTAAMAGACDVLVCDGFVGNILLKAAEGAVATVQQLLREEIARRPSGIFGAWLLSGAFQRFRKRVEWDAHGGAVLLGAKGIVVAGHGRANAQSVHAAIRVAHDAASHGLEATIERRIQAYVTQH